MQTQVNINDLMDCDVTDSTGHKVGTVRQVYLNDVTGEPEWVRVHTGWFGTRESFVPLADARRAGDTLQVPYDKDKVKHAPAMDADQHLSREQVADLYRYYGLRAPAAGRKTVPDQVGTAREGRTQAQAAQAQQAQEGRDAQAMGGPGEQQTRERTGEGAAAKPPAQTGRAERSASKTGQMTGAHGRVAGERPTTRAADGMVELTLSEERLRVGTERHEAERVRLRKRIEIEQVERTVAVYREELRIEREPIGEQEAQEGMGRFRIGDEEEREIILHEERPVVSKDVIPVERIRVRAERIAGEQTVRDEIRKERIDIAHETPGGGMPDSGAPAAERRETPPAGGGRHERR